VTVIVIVVVHSVVTEIRVDHVEMVELMSRYGVCVAWLMNLRFGTLC
jgi:hypothetical protein